ncbi:MAG TPA: hypothetical protein VGM53_02505 [Streptosporangiaceae bacterium]|jgi:hypothetical protein
MLDWPPRQRNTIRYTFLHPAARDLWPDWEQKAKACVAHLRAVAGTDPDAPDLAALIGELIVKSADFTRLWERYDVRTVGFGQKTFRHPVVGTLTLAHEVLRINGTSGLRATVYMAEAGTPRPRQDPAPGPGGPGQHRPGTGRAGQRGSPPGRLGRPAAHRPSVRSRSLTSCRGGRGRSWPAPRC